MQWADKANNGGVFKGGGGGSPHFLGSSEEGRKKGETEQYGMKKNDIIV